MISAVNNLAVTKTRPFLASFLFVALLLTQACDTNDGEVVLHGSTMGTTYNIKYVDEAKTSKADTEANISNLLDYLDGAMSTYQPQSELNRLNDLAVDEAFKASGMLWQVLLVAEQVFSNTAGAFDPTVGPLVDLWGFGPVDTQGRVPTEAEINELLASVGFNQLEFLPASQSVRKLANIRIDLSAIAKGYAAEKTAELLTDMGITDFLIEIGGELRVGGVNGQGNPWRIAIETPGITRGGIQRIISVENKGIATSGDYRNFFEKGGVRYSHTIDPRTGSPTIHNLASVTVVAEDATVADALATGLLVLGPQHAAAMANSHGIAALFILNNPAGFVEIASDEFKPYRNIE
jgi:thiamine biosynthesis lipoprotein